MQKSLVALSTLAALGLFACQPNTSDEATTTTTETTQAPSGSGESMTDAQKQAYAMGASMGLFVNNRAQQQEQLGLPLDQAALKEGFNDGLNDSLKLLNKVSKYCVPNSRKWPKPPQQKI